MSEPEPTAEPLLAAVARELARRLGGRARDHLAEAREILRLAVRESEAVMGGSSVGS